MLWNWLIPCSSPHLLPGTGPRDGMLWGSGALPASGTRAFEEEEVAREGWLAQSSGSLHVTPGTLRSAAVTCRAAPRRSAPLLGHSTRLAPHRSPPQSCLRNCSISIAPHRTQDKPDVHRVCSSPTKSPCSQGSTGMGLGDPSRGTAVPCKDTGKSASGV